MRNRYEHSTLPITWEGWDEIGVAAYIFYNVEFTEDFGDIKKGDKFESVIENNMDGYLEVYDKNNDTDIKYRIKYIVVEKYQN